MMSIFNKAAQNSALLLALLLIKTSQGQNFLNEAETPNQTD